MASHKLSGETYRRVFLVTFPPCPQILEKSRTLSHPFRHSTKTSSMPITTFPTYFTYTVDIQCSRFDSTAD